MIMIKRKILIGIDIGIKLKLKIKMKIKAVRAWRGRPVNRPTPMDRLGWKGRLSASY
jgi:hypothetical protein